VLQIFFSEEKRLEIRKPGEEAQPLEGWLHKLALTDCETVFEVNLLVSEFPPATHIIWNQNAANLKK
jgi:hypothetical protein